MSTKKILPLADFKTIYLQGGPKKVSHFQGLSLNRIKNRQCGYISYQF